MKILLELDTDDCLLLADLLRSRLMHMEKEGQYEIDKTDVRLLQEAFRKLSNDDPDQTFVVVRY